MGLMDSLQHGFDRIQHGWNAFKNNKDPTMDWSNIGNSYHSRPDRVRYTRGNERSIITSIYNRLALDAASIDIEHVQLDEDGLYESTKDSYLNECLTVEANIDQTGRAFKQDVYASLFDEGCIAIVPVETTLDPNITGAYDVNSVRVGKIVEWRPKSVKINLYNDRTGEKEDIWMEKRNVAIVENPFYAVMNERNSIMQRLARKLALLDAVDEQTSSGKLDMIIQLPYTIKSQTRRDQAEIKRQEIERQLNGDSKYGIAYVDATDKIIQLNRPLENNLLKQIEYLTSMLFSQLGLTQEIMDGRADEATMNNYYARTIEPVVAAVADEMKRKFLTKAARTKGQSITYFRDVFSLMPITAFAKTADSLTRNEIATSNEIRQHIGWKPSKDPRANELRNKNLNGPSGEQMLPEETNLEEGESQNGEV
jgi:hypothetical protein